MKTAPSYAIDSSAILYLAQMGPDHTNVYRFSAKLKEPVEVDCLQKAAERICSRFPTILAGFKAGAFSYAMIPVRKAPVVQQSPGLLHVMSPEEMETCAYRIYYEGCHIMIEAFHALTDGYGAVASLRALLGEYLYQKYGVISPEQETIFSEMPDWEEELRDAYQDHCGKEAAGLAPGASYQLPRTGEAGDITATTAKVSTRELLAAAKKHGISMTILLSGLMAEAIMELQRTGRKKPVRIMVPIDLRRQFPSKTFRNFILYALPTLKPEEAGLPRHQRFARFQEQLRHQTRKSFMAAQITRNVAIQNSLLFRCLPLSWKCTLMRLSYRFFGETNSSITLTNLGPLPISETLRSYVEDVDVYLTPRRKSPYNCGVLSYGDTTSITITRFGTQTELEELFFAKLQGILAC